MLPARRQRQKNVRHGSGRVAWMVQLLPEQWPHMTPASFLKPGASKFMMPQHATQDPQVRPATSPSCASFVVIIPSQGTDGAFRRKPHRGNSIRCTGVNETDDLPRGPRLAA
jgi:hypothetical protein